MQGASREILLANLTAIRSGHPSDGLPVKLLEFQQNAVNLKTRIIKLQRTRRAWTLDYAEVFTAFRVEPCYLNVGPS